MSFSDPTHRTQGPAGAAFGPEEGAAGVELALILPILAVMLFGLIDFGRFVQARLVITNLSREGGSLASRDIESSQALIAMLQSSSSPLDMKDGLGKICVSQIDAGKTGPNADTDPVIDAQFVGGGLDVPCGVGSQGESPAGLAPDLYAHLVYDDEKKTSDIAGLTVVEVFYKYKPITPLPGFIANILLKDGDGTVIGSKAVF